MRYLNLEKGDKAWMLVWRGNCYAKVLVTVSAKRVSRLGTVTFYVKNCLGKKVDCTFHGYGGQNFKTWRDAVWCSHAKMLCDSEKEAERIIKASKEG